MLVIGSVVTVLSLAGGAYVQASLSGQDDDEEAAEVQDTTEQAEDTAEPDEPARPPALTERSSAVTEVPLPAPNAGRDFTVFCPAGDGTATQNTCRVRSYNGFSAPVNLSCTGTPPGIGCTFSPAVVTPPPGGSARFTLQIVLSDTVAPGGHVFNVTGRSADLANSYRYPLLLTGEPGPLPTGQAPLQPAPPPAQQPPQDQEEPPSLEPSFTIACSLNPGPETVIDKLLWSLGSGEQGTIKCIVKPVNGFDEEVTMQLTNVSGDLDYEFDPPVVLPAPSSPSPDGPTVGPSSFVDLNFALGNLQNGAEYAFDVTGVSETVTNTRRVILTVTDQT